MAHQMSDRMHECIDRCQSGEAICIEAVNHCLELGGKHAASEHIRLLMACAEICSTSARFLLLGSKHHSRTCDVCAEVCEACARDCEQFTEDELMQRCTDVCRRCADSCRQMAMAKA